MKIDRVVDVKCKCDIYDGLPEVHKKRGIVLS